MPPSLHLWAMKKREEEEEEGVFEVGSGQEDKLLQGYNRRAERNKYPSCFWGRERDRDTERDRQTETEIICKPTSWLGKSGKKVTLRHGGGGGGREKEHEHPKKRKKTKKRTR